MPQNRRTGAKCDAYTRTFNRKRAGNGSFRPFLAVPRCAQRARNDAARTSFRRYDAARLMSWRRVLLLSSIFVVVLCGATWAILQRSDAATSLVQRRLNAALRTEASIAGTELDLAAGRLVVKSLRIADPTRPGTALARAERIDLDAEFDLPDLVGLSRVAIAGLEVDIGPELPDAEQLFGGDLGGGGAADLPAIAIENARLQLGCTPGEAPIAFEQIDLQATPVRGERHVLALQGAGRVVGLDARVSLAGRIDTASGESALTATVLDWPLQTPCLRWLEDRLGVRLGDLEIAGELDRLEIAFAVGRGDASPRPTRIDVRGEVHAARLIGANLPRHLKSADVTFPRTTDDGGELRVSVRQSTAQGEIDLSAEITALSSGEPSYAVHATGRNLVVDADTTDALRLFPIGANVVDALLPEAGRADIELYLKDAHLSTGIAEFEMNVRDGELTYYGYGSAADRIGFPLPLVGARGTVRLRDDIVELDGMTATIAPSAGGGDVTLSGRIDTRAAPTESTTLDIGASGVAFTPDLRRALANLLEDDGRLYDRLQPQGRADVDVSVRPMSELAGSFLVHIRPQAATVTWGGFPYRLGALDGEIVVREAEADFDLEGSHGNGRVALRGRIPLAAAKTGDNDAPGFQVSVDVADLAIDDELRRAVKVMAPAIDTAWRSCAPNGKCSGVVRAWRATEDADLGFDLQIDVEGVDLRLPVEPWRARQLAGRLLIAGSGERARIDFDALRGELDHGAGLAAKLAMLGRVEYGGEGDSDVSLVVRGLELDEQLGRTLEQLGALGPGIWNYLQPSGSVDLVFRHRVTPNEDTALDLVVHLLDVGSAAPILPMPARRMTGEVLIRGGRATFEELRADLGDQLVRCLDGSIETAPAPDGRTLIGFTVKAADFPLGGELANLFPGPLHRAIAERKLSGTADIDRLRLMFAVPTRGSSMPFETVLDGELRLQDVALTLGTGSEGFRVDRLYGNVRLEECRIGDTGGELVGKLDNASLRLFGQPFEGLSASFAAGAERITLAAVTARLHGGLLNQPDTGEPAFVYTMPSPESPEGRLAANLAFQGVDVHAFLTTTGWVSPPYRGSARGSVALEHLDGHDIVDATAGGTLAIERADLGAVPLFTAIYSQLPAPERPRFSELDTRWRLADRRITFDDLVVKSNLLAAKGSGALDLDGYLNVKLTLENLLGNTADPLFRPFVDLFTNSIVRFHLFGHLRDLKAEKRWITEAAPRRQPVPPLPPAPPERPVVDY
ncbi:MAG: hypothetical protein KDE27_12085 [Planctomycetes bacterium]|nr:hypothetical protein [Planctomycetota bacterium]